MPLDFPWDYPRIEPPQELADYLLGATAAMAVRGCELVA